MSKKYSLFIGRWQPWHAGHQWLIDQRLNEGKNVCIAIRDVLDRRFIKEIREGKIKVTIIPDIESVNYGRGVGYEIIEHVPPNNVKEISATKIREQMRQDGKL